MYKGASRIRYPTYFKFEHIMLVTLQDEVNFRAQLTPIKFEGFIYKGESFLPGTSTYELLYATRSGQVGKNQEKEAKLDKIK